MNAAVDMMNLTGLIIFRDMLPQNVVDHCHAAYLLRAKQIDQGLASRGTDLNTQFRYNEVVRRRTARLDIRCTNAPEAGFHASALHDEAPWLPFVRSLLGEAAKECWRGVVDNRPGSETQGWHRDGQPLFLITCTCQRTAS